MSQYNGWWTAFREFNDIRLKYYVSSQNQLYKMVKLKFFSLRHFHVWYLCIHESNEKDSRRCSRTLRRELSGARNLSTINRVSNTAFSKWNHEGNRRTWSFCFFLVFHVIQAESDLTIEQIIDSYSTTYVAEKSNFPHSISSTRSN